MDCVCNNCLKSYTNNEKLGLHQKKRHSHERLVKGKSQNICKPCGKSFDRKANFDSHVKVHLKQNAEQFNYTECDKGFNRKESLTLHRWMHTEKIETESGFGTFRNVKEEEVKIWKHFICDKICH